MNKVVMAIDPGSLESAYVVWDGKTIISHGKEPNPDVKAVIGGAAFDGAVIVIEQIKHYGTGMPAGNDVFETCVWTGRFIEACGEDNRIARKTVCAHICRNATAKDANIRQALIDRLGPPHTKETYTPLSTRGRPLKPRERTVDGPTAGITKDCWSALALALTWWDLNCEVQE
jgi:hypothetical protein